ncbi:HECT-type E3 ubiquitin transferase [Malassezia yamatoensis]|uniref:HECT-type E3 ubiquitin transferase n=1 Tax=Malassezia yamatoensis TaxID=253288 RepID=A0AAJ5YUL4_9BASI|nr:HECT-type E3 ubiquitin transferase [Malassezia yamatoensis]
MKISKAPKRKPEVPVEVAALCARVMDTDDRQLPELLVSIDQWPWPRGDLYTWVGVLNRFDGILERICDEHKFEPVQMLQFDYHTQSLLCSVLHFSRILLENCMNRKLYASYEHLNCLLGTSDDLVLQSVLHLLLRPSQQHSGMTHSRHELPVSQTRLAILASVWPLREAGVDLVSAVTHQPGNALHGVHMHYYKHASTSSNGKGPDSNGAASASASAVSNESTTATVNGSGPAGDVPATASGSEMPQTPSRNSGHDASHSRQEGLTRVEIRLDSEQRSAAEVFQQVSERKEMSDDEQFELYQRIRLAIASRSRESLRMSVVIRLFAIACFTHIVPEAKANSRLFAAEPNLIQRIVCLLDHAEVQDIAVQSVAMYALDSLAHYRGRLQEVLAALNASVSHGTLLEVLQRMMDRLSSMNGNLSDMDAYVDAVMTLVAYLTTTVSGSSMIVGAGLVPRLLELSKLPSNVYLVQRTVSRTIGLLDSVMYAYPPAFQQFVDANGVETVVNRVAAEVESGQQISNTAPLSSSSSNSSAQAKDASSLPFGQSSVLRNLLKLLLHLMTTPGTAEGLRNLIDTSLLSSLRTILQCRKVFGPLVLAQAINIMATFVHNEPTLLPTLQEQHLPEAFVEVVTSDIEANFELLSAMTTAVGALCLNEAGLALLTQHQVVRRLLSVLDSEQHQKMLLDRDHANVMGAAMDELVRHQPSFKTEMQTQIAQILQHLIDAAELWEPPADDLEVWSQYRLLAVEDPKEVAIETEPTIRVEDLTLDEADTMFAEPNARDTNGIVASFDVQCRFLEGLFRNSSYCREFLDRDGLTQLLRFYSTPCLVYNFASTTPADSFVTLLRVMTDVRAEVVIQALMQTLCGWMDQFASQMQQEPSIINLLTPTEQQLPDFNARFRALVALNVHAHLLSDLCQTFAYAAQKLSLQLLQTLLGANKQGERLVQMAHIQRHVAYEVRLFQAAAIQVPRAAPKGDATTPIARNATAINYVGTQISASLLTILGESVRMLAPRRTLDATYRATSWDVAQALGRAFAEYFTERKHVSEANAFAELAYVFHVLNSVLLDERGNTIHVHTFVLNAFEHSGGLEQFSKRMQSLEAPLQRLASQEQNLEDCKSWALATEALRIGLNLLLHCTQSRPILESPHTAQLMQREPESDPNTKFEPQAFLVKMRLASLPYLRRLWEGAWISRLPIRTLRTLIRVLLVVMKGDAESVPKREAQGPSSDILRSTEHANQHSHSPHHALFSSLASLAGRPVAGIRRGNAVRADPQRVAQLVEMGFSTGASRRALQRTHNNVSAATEHVLQHPELEDEPDEMETESLDQEAEQPAVNLVQDAAQASQAAQPSQDTQPQSAQEENLIRSLPGIETMLENSVQDDSSMRSLPRSLFEYLNGAGNLGSTLPNPSANRESEMQSVAKQQLDSQRAEFLPEMLPRALQLAETHEALVFDAKAIFLLRTQSKSVAELWTEVLQPVYEWQSNLSVSEDYGKRVAVLLHFAVLLLHSSEVQNDVHKKELHPFLRCCIGMAKSQQQQQQPSEPSAQQPSEPRWWTSCLLCICSILTLCERPRATQIDRNKPVTPLIDDDELRLLQETRQELVPFAIWGLENFSMWTKDAMLAMYRLLVLITRQASTAAQLQHCLPKLFAPLAQSDGLDDQCDRFTLMIVRHIIEYAGVLTGKMDSEMYSWVTNHVRAKSSESTSFSKGMSFAIERDLEVFLGCAERQVEILDFNETKSQAYLRLRQDAKPGNEIGGEQVSDAVIKFLLDALLEPSQVSSRESYRFFVLQTLTELLSSYMVCKQSFLRYPLWNSDRKPLNVFLTELVPSGFLKSYEANELRTRMAESNWAMSVLVALAADPCAMSDAKQVAEPLVVIRKTLLDAIAKAFREASVGGEPVEVCYGRLYALSDLCYRLLTAQPNACSMNGAGNPVKLHTEVALHLAKTMLEKSYVSILTCALAEVDLNMPTVKTLLGGMLRPLEHLTKVAMKMGKSSAAQAHKNAKADAQQPSADSMDEEEEHEDASEDDQDSSSSDDQDAPDFYRNSSLGMHTGEMEHGFDQDSLSDDEEEIEEDEDIEMNEYDSQESELSTDEEGLDGDSAHVIEVMEEDDDEDEDDDDQDDDEDDDDDDEDDDSEEDDSDFVSEFDPADYELNSEGLPEHDFDYVIEEEVDGDGAPTESPDPHTGEVGQLLEALDGMGQHAATGDVHLDQDEQHEDDDDDEEQDLYDHGELSQYEMADDVEWPLRSHDDRFGASWHWMQAPPRHGATSEAPPSFFPRVQSRENGVEPAWHRPMPMAVSSAPMRGNHDRNEHPLLIDDRPPTEPYVERSGNGGMDLGSMPGWQRNVEALVGGGTMQVLEMLLNRAAPSHMDTSIRIELADGGRGAPRMHITNVGMDGVPNSRRAGGDAGAASSSRTDSASQAYRFTPLTTSARWAEEAQLVHGPLVTEHAMYVRNHLINRLLPSYYARKAAEAQAKEHEEQQRRAREEELRDLRQLRTQTSQQITDSKRKLHELENDTGSGDASHDASRTANRMSDQESSADAPQSRVTVIVNGEPVDLTNTGIDPTFLEALPDELREEALLSQQLSQQRAEPLGLERDFLDALPARLRSEVAADDSSSNQATASAANASRPETSAPETSTTPAPAPAAATSRAVSDTGREDAHPTSSSASNAHRDAIQLVDRAGIATLVRLLYFPQMQTRSSSLLKVLSHLAENAKTRAELLNLLLMVLSDGTASIQAVDKSFAHMSSRAVRTSGTPRRAMTASGSLPWTPTPAQSSGQPTTPGLSTPQNLDRTVAPLSSLGDEAPYLIASRSIETMMHLVQANDQVASYFLCEEVRSKKRTREARSPLHTLLGLLEKEAILTNAQLVDALCALLNIITKPLANAAPCPSASSSAVAVLSASQGGGEVLPIGSERVAGIVRPLRTAISSRGFQHTLAVASHLAHLPGMRDTLSNALQHEADRASSCLVNDLDSLIETLPSADNAQVSAEQLHVLPLAKLASPTSAQAQLLRCLRALDYLYMGK